MDKQIVKYGFVALALFGPAVSQAVVLTEVARHDPFLGAAYQSEKEDFVSQSCLTIADSNIKQIGKASSGLSFQQSMSEGELSKELGFDLDSRAQFGVTKVGVDVSFLKNSVSHNLSLSAIWESSYEFPTEKLVVTKDNLNETAKSMLETSQWATTCGDRFVDEIQKGAKLFFSIRVDFKSLEEKQRFQAKFSLEGPLVGVNTSLKTASTEFSRSTHIVVSAYQVGGDVSKLTKLFDTSSDGQKGFVDCNLGQFDQCAKVIESAIRYAADTENGFPSQLKEGAKPGPTTVGFNTASYKSIGVYPVEYPGLEEATKIARHRLSLAFNKEFKRSITAIRILERGNLGKRREKVDAELAKVNRNISKMLTTSDVCYLTPQNCHETVTALLDTKQSGDKSVEEVDETVFLPETFDQLCANVELDANLSETFEVIRNRLNLGAADCAAIKAELAKRNDLTIDASGMLGEFDLRTIAPFKRLTELHIRNGAITEVSPVADLTKLKVLDLSSNHISEIEPISDLVDLVRLDLSQNLIENVQPLSGLLRLSRLYLQNNRIKSLDGIEFLPQLVGADLQFNPLPADQVQSFKNRMPKHASITY